VRFLQAAHYHKGRIRPVRVIVVHAMQMPERPGTAEACAQMFHTTDRDASAHVCVDADSEVRCVQDEDTAWAAPGANADGLQIEHAGFSEQSRADWSDPYSSAMLRRSVVVTAAWCKRFGIPARQLSNAQLADGRSKGFVSHHQVSQVFRKSSHWDPGPGFPWRSYLALVADELGDSAPKPTPVEDDMPLTDADVDKVAAAVVSQLLGRSGPTVGVALQDGYQKLERLEAAVAAIAQRLATPGASTGASGPVLTRADIRAELVAALRSVQ
jgi:N-acetyl-anhydromuramyl-L-alanine amidase AmpD